MHTLKSLSLAVLLLGGCFTARTAEPVWSLQDCFDHALTHNLEIRQQKFNEDRAAADLDRARANLLPNLHMYSSQGFSYGRTVDRFTNEFATERVFGHNMYGSSDVLLFAGFNQINGIRYQLMRNTAMRYDTERVKNDVFLSIAAAYLQVLYHKDMLDVRQQQLEVTLQQLERSHILFNGGTLTRGAVLEMEAQAAYERLAVQEAENMLDLSYLELVHLLDLDPDEAFAIDRPDADASSSHYLLQPPDEILERVMRQEPSMLASRERIGMAERMVAINRGAMSPRLSLSTSLGTGYSQAAIQVVDHVETGRLSTIGFTESNEKVFRPETTPVMRRKPYRDQLRDNYNTQITMSLHIPIFNRMQLRTQLGHARIDLESARVQHEQVKNHLSRVIRQAHADATAAYQQFLATEKSMEAFRELFNHTEQRFNLGMVSALEYNEAKARLARAESEAIQARYTYVFRTGILSFYLGEGFSI